MYTGSFVTLAIGRVTTSVGARDHAGTRSPPLVYVYTYMYAYICTLFERERNENEQASVYNKTRRGGGVTNKRDTRVTTKPTLFTFTGFVYVTRLLLGTRAQGSDLISFHYP